MTVQTPARPEQGHLSLAATGREYLRVSADRSGRQRSPGEQHSENLEEAAARGVTLAEPYRETDAVSASRYSTKTRDAFDQLLDDLKADRFDAAELWLWENSRGSRRVSEWTLLLELCEERGVKIYIKSHGRLYDPGNGRDRRTLLEDAVDSEYSSWQTSERIKRAMRDNARQGRPHGQPPYGYRAVHHERTGGFVGWEPDPERAAVVVELFDRIRKGHSLSAIARDFELRGVVHKTGKPFTPSHLRDMIEKPSYIGKRSWYGEIIDGTWEPLVDEETFYAVQRILADPKRTTARNTGGVHDFTGTLVCDECGGPMFATFTLGSAAYKCRRGIRVDKAEVDTILYEAIFDYLSHPDVYERFAARPSDDAQARKVAEELARLRAELAEMEAEDAETLSEAKVLARSIDRKLEKIAAAEHRQRELTTPSTLSDLIEPGKDIEKRWFATPISARRKAVKILLSPQYLGQVRITRADDSLRRADGTRMRQPAHERMVWRRES